MLERMHAVVQQAFGGTEVLEVAEVDRPVPLATEVLVRVETPTPATSPTQLSYDVFVSDGPVGAAASACRTELSPLSRRRGLAPGRRHFD